MTRSRYQLLSFCAALSCLLAACIVGAPKDALRHRWWSGLGPVLPHDTFPANCNLCHVGDSWQEVRPDFEFDHEAETGYPLAGAHQVARCLRCHNDRGPVATFEARGCVGCHEDIHYGELGTNCTECHDQRTWNPTELISAHHKTRFPLVGAHAAVACYRCHPGSEVGDFRPTDTDCLTCHAQDLARTTNHVGLGWVDNCDRCHLPVDWNLAEIGQ